MSAAKSRWQKLFKAVLAINALFASLIAVGLVIIVSAWLYSLSTQQARKPDVASQARAEPRRIDVPVVRHVKEPKSVAAVAVAPDHREDVPAPAAGPTPSSTFAAPVILPPEHHSEAGLNRAIGEALSGLAKDPELRRKLGIVLPP